MKKDYKKIFHFSQPDLQVFYYDGNFKKNYDMVESGKYAIFVFFSGVAKAEYENKIFYLKPGDTFFTNKNEKYTLEFQGKNLRFLCIWFSTKFFHELDPKIDILSPFSFSHKDEIKIYSKDVTNEHYIYAVNNIIRSLEEQFSRAPMLSAVLQLICEIHYIYNKLNPTPLINTDSNFAKLEGYIDDHLFEKITLKSVSEATFLSERNITYMLRKISGQSFHEYLTENRLNRAKKLMEGKFYPLNEVASLCGFPTYSTFYRAYLKKYGVPPSEDKF